MTDQTQTPAPPFSQPAAVVMAADPGPAPALPRERRVWMAVRQGLLLIVTAIEEYLAIPKEKSALVARRVN